MIDVPLKLLFSVPCLTKLGFIDIKKSGIKKSEVQQNKEIEACFGSYVISEVTFGVCKYPYRCGNVASYVISLIYLTSLDRLSWTFRIPLSLKEKGTYLQDINLECSQC